MKDGSTVVKVPSDVPASARDSYIENYQAMTKESAPGLYSKDLPFSILGSSRGTGASSPARRFHLGETPAERAGEAGQKGPSERVLISGPCSGRH